MLYEKKIDGSTVYEGVIVNVRRDRAELVNGSVVWCVRQFRYPIGREMLELPAGKLERGEDPFECAVRELSEETGLTADKYVNLGSFCTSPGFCTEVLHIYLALGLHRGDMHLDPGEFLNVEKYKLDELVRMVMACEIDDAKTIIGVLKAHKYLEDTK